MILFFEWKGLKVYTRWPNFFFNKKKEKKKKEHRVGCHCRVTSNTLTKLTWYPYYTCI